MKKACVIGWPINHSRSPLIHNYWLKKHGIIGSYERIAVEPENLKKFIHNLASSGFEGCNVTIPHKENAIQAVDHYDEKVAQTGSLNTVFIRDNKTHATSTDGDGFYKNVLTHCPSLTIDQKNVMILGAGGSSRAIVQNLLSKNAKSIFVYNRTKERALELQNVFGNKIIPVAELEIARYLTQTDLLVNTIPQTPRCHSSILLQLDILPKQAIVADIVYVPLKTELIKKAEQLGLRTVPGLGMLLHQAVEGFHLWFGVRPEVTQELYDLVAADIISGQPK